MKKVLFTLALLGWIASLTVHLSSLDGSDISKEYPIVMALHAGVFVVFIPMIFYLKKDETYQLFQKSELSIRMNPVKQFKVLFRNTPPLLKLIALGGMIYVFVNFFLSMGVSPAEMNMTRMFSGHWLCFYGLAVGVLYPFKRAVAL